MTVAEGQVHYSQGQSPCLGRGLVWSEAELEAALAERVSHLVFDDEGRADLEEILSALAETDFEMDGLRAILKDPDAVEDWRVGEAIAEAYLSDHRSCAFPWPDGRDERKSGSSLPGADLVGLQADEEGDTLAFGEVKTSTEAKYPPSTMYGRTGLKQQLEDLRDRKSIRDDLLKYLCYRAKAAPWRPRFEAASRRYLKNNADVRLFGVLIRDVDPHVDDIRVRVVELAKDCPEGTRIELIALYLPKGRIDGLGADLVARRKEGGE